MSLEKITYEIWITYNECDNNRGLAV